MIDSDRKNITTGDRILHVALPCIILAYIGMAVLYHAVRDGVKAIPTIIEDKMYNILFGVLLGVHLFLWWVWFKMLFMVLYSWGL